MTHRPYELLIALLLLTVGLLLNGMAFARKARTVRLDDKKTESIFITPGRSTILSFPTHPSKVILGNQGLFTVEYVENDLRYCGHESPGLLQFIRVP